MSESSDDKDMLDMAVSELDEALEEEKRLQTLLLKSLLPKDEADERDCILEVRAGTLINLWFLKHRSVPTLPMNFKKLSVVFFILRTEYFWVRDWWRRGFFVCHGYIQNVSASIFSAGRSYYPSLYLNFN